MNPSTCLRHRGFTLLELLVAIAIFSLLSVIAYSGIRSVITSREVVDENMTRLAELQRTVLSLGDDLRQATSRGIRDEYGDQQKAFISAPLTADTGEIRLELTRAGYPNPLGTTRSNLQRVAYLVEDHTLYRLSWPNLDRAPDELPRKTALCSHIDGLSLRYLDFDRNWHEQWPPLKSGDAGTLPQAVEITLELADWGDITRLYAVAGES
jgi:general secretion pathway protein J